MDDTISKLSEIRSEYNCFDDDEAPLYRALSEAIRILSQRADGDTISRAAAIDEFPEDNLPWDTFDGYVAPHHVRKIMEQLPSAQPNLKGAKFEIICSQRQTGRTTKLIEKCARYRYALIVCPSRMRASNIFHYARKMGIHIPMPMTFGDFLQGRFAAEHINAFLIDDLDQCLAIYSRNVPIDTVVFERRAEE